MAESSRNSCRKCTKKDHDRMVQCDNCDTWFHFECVGVTEDIAECDWMCDLCVAAQTSKRNEALSSHTLAHPDKEKDAQVNVEEPVSELQRQMRISKSINSKASNSSKAKRNRDLKLQQLEEEMRTKIEYLQSKYAVMREYDDDNESSPSDSEDDGKSGTRTVQWVEATNKGTHKVGNAGHKIAPPRIITLPTHTSQPDPKTTILSASQLGARQVVGRDLPIFTGKPEEWPMFISSYENSTRLCGFSYDENLLRLQRALKGRALEYTSGKLTMPELVPEIISTLRMVFGRPEHIISSLHAKLRESPGVNANKLETLVSFALEVKNLTATMAASGLQAHLTNPMLVQELISKLPPQMRLNWASFSRQENVDLMVFSNWLYDLAEATSSVMPLATMSARDSEKRKGYRVAFHEQEEQHGSTNDNNATNANCAVCTKVHSVPRCNKFKAMSHYEKWDTVRKYKLCRSCLKCHNPKFCRERNECGIDGCTFKHHALLHKANANPNSNTNGTVVAIQRSYTSDTLYKIIPVTIYGKNCSVDLYAFLDDGSGPTLIEDSILRQIQARGTSKELCLRWTDGTTHVEQDSTEVNLQISARGQDNKKVDLHGVRSMKSLDLPSQTMVVEELSKRYSHLRGLPVTSYHNAVPKLIIGLNNRNAAMPLKFREGRASEPAAAKTRLGWTIFGVVKEDAHNDLVASECNLHFHICECDNDVALQKLVIESMNIDKVAEYDATSAAVDDKLLEKHVSRGADKFITRLLWKHENIMLPDNFEMALRRLSCFEKKLCRQPDLLERVNEHIQQMENKGYIRELTAKEVRSKYARKWYLPIFAVNNPNKPQKTRLVWDAAAEYRGVSLNACLEKGPDLMVPLFEILINFRIGKVGISADICEMFQRVGVHEEDAQSQRFLWRQGSAHNELKVYILQVMSFGAACSPSLAQYVKNRNASDHQIEFPRAAKSIIQRHYVDDLMDSADSVAEAIQLGREVREIHRRGNFHIRNWLSNAPEVTQALGEEGKNETFCSAAKRVDHVIEPEKVLGMWWQTTNDMFTYSLKFTKVTTDILDGQRLPTKREILRLLMSIFDPLGLISFFTVDMKILLQGIWRCGINWDDTIPEEYAGAWTKWLAALKHVEEVQVPRCYFPTIGYGSGDIQLHVMVDASDSAYAAVAYLRTERQGAVEIALVGAKSKVAPLRPISIPRMELLGAVVGARLGNTIVDALDMNIKSTHYWSDSNTVLTWLRSNPRTYKQFVMFRVGEIQDTTCVENWHYVPSKLNIADLATKVSVQHNFKPESPWFSGPTFLRSPPQEWPSSKLKQHADDTSEHRTTKNKMQYVVQISSVQAIVDVNRFSRWERLVRCMAYVRRFINCLKAKKQGKSSNGKSADAVNFLTTEELYWGRQFLYQLAQSETFGSEIVLMRLNPAAIKPKSSPLKGLSAFLDADGVLRMRGRIERAEFVNDATKNPIIMPKDHRITHLLVDWYHRKWKHVFHETVINEIFQTYHITGLRKLLRTIRKNCRFCKLRTAAPNPPEMGPLPKARLSPHVRPFTYVGVDFFGPFLTTVGRRSEKRYGAIFTCLTCRAVHIEMAYSLSMNSCVVVVRNFMARRGTPAEFYSDNGTNLRAAEKELREAYQLIDFGAMRQMFTSSETKWTFIPPASPHMGGAWERLVRSIKKVLYQIINPDTKVTDEKLNNLFMEVESIINSRPLTYLSLETAEEEALTPNHLLLGSSSGARTAGKFEEADQYVKASWRHSQLLADKFWKRWIAEYLPTLTRRTKWYDKVKPVEPGDVVIIVDCNLPRHCWPRGIVTRVITGQDGQTRNAFVRTSGGEYHRPVAKLAILEVKEEGGSVNDMDQGIFIQDERSTGGENVTTSPLD